MIKFRFEDYFVKKLSTFNAIFQEKWAIFSRKSAYFYRKIYSFYSKIWQFL